MSKLILGKRMSKMENVIPKPADKANVGSGSPCKTDMEICC